MEQLLESPLLLAAVALVILFIAGRFVWRWRRESSLRDHAGDQGWRPVEHGEPFADLVTRQFPELRDQAEQDARASRRSGAKRGGGPGVNVSLTASAGARSRTKARSVYLVPIEDGEFAAGDVAVTGTTGKLAQGRSTVQRGAVAARLPSHLPPLKLHSRSWFDRDGGGVLPEQLRSRFNDVELDDEARAAYLDSGAWQALLDAPEEVDGIAVDDGRVVVLSRKRLTPERVEALTDTARRFVVEAAGSSSDNGSASDLRLTDPLSSR